MNAFAGHPPTLAATARCGPLFSDGLDISCLFPIAAYEVTCSEQRNIADINLYVCVGYEGIA
jgi:hypothetical protein